MNLKRLKNGIMKIEVRSPKPERFINKLWNSGIRVLNIQKINITTIYLDIKIRDYDEVENIGKITGSKIKIIGTKGIAFKVLKLKKQSSLIIGFILFILILFSLSRYIWAIQIETTNDISCLEVREQLKELGIKQGIRKSSINVYDMERSLENKNPEIMWVRARMEGSTLKVKIEEKVNPPVIEKDAKEGDLIAKMDGEIVSIYTISGTANVKPSDVIKKGQVLIKGVEGKEGAEYKTKAEGVAIANTFYERNMQLQVEGDKTQRTGEEEEAIYIEFFGKKIYIKKPIKSFEDYDKIEKKGKILNKVVYYEKKLKHIEKDREQIIKEAVDELRKNTMEGVGNESKFIKDIVNTEDIGEGKIKLNAIFVIQQDITFRLSS